MVVLANTAIIGEAKGAIRKVNSVVAVVVDEGLIVIEVAMVRSEASVMQIQEFD